jgi:hypothetical protein
MKARMRASICIISLLFLNVFYEKTTLCEAVDVNSLKNGITYANVNNLQIEADKGNIHVIPSTSTTTIVYGDSAEDISLGKNGNTLQIKYKKQGFWDFGKEVNFSICIGSSVEKLEINLGSGTISVEGNVKSLQISGGDIVFSGVNLFGIMNFEFGKGTVNLIYNDSHSLDAPVFCKYEAGKADVNIRLSKAFKTVRNSVKGGLVKCNSFLPVINEHNADINLTGKAGKFTLTVVPIDE